MVGITYVYNTSSLVCTVGITYVYDNSSLVCMVGITYVYNNSSLVCMGSIACVYNKSSLVCMARITYVHTDTVFGFYEHLFFLKYPSPLLSWMFGHDSLDTCCFACLIYMCFVFLYLHLFSTTEQDSHRETLYKYTHYYCHNITISKRGVTAEPSRL